MTSVSKLTMEDVREACNLEDCDDFCNRINNLLKILDPDNQFKLKWSDSKKIKAAAVNNTNEIIVSRYLIAKLQSENSNQNQNDDIMAMVIAHEIGHHKLGHTQSNLAFDVLLALLFILSLGLILIPLCSRQRRREYAADYYAAQLLMGKGINIDRATKMFKVVLHKTPENMTLMQRLLRTHPTREERHKTILAHINEINQAAVAS